MAKIKFKIATPEKIVYEDEIDQIVLPTKMGEVTILPGHIPLVSSLVPGEVLIKRDNQEAPMAVSGGFVEFNNNNLVILADTAERVEEIDEARAEEARAKVKKLLNKRQDIDEVGFASLAAKMEKELARLKVVKKYKKLRKGPQIRIEEDKEDYDGE
jgi:F-type H+-transporting ATPase subunit epsilon